jgi:hypothetical protein
MRLISRNLGWCVSPQRTPGFLGTALALCSAPLARVRSASHPKCRSPHIQSMCIHGHVYLLRIPAYTHAVYTRACSSSADPCVYTHCIYAGMFIACGPPYTQHVSPVKIAAYAQRAYTRACSLHADTSVYKMFIVLRPLPIRGHVYHV